MCYFIIFVGLLEVVLGLTFIAGDLNDDLSFCFKVGVVVVVVLDEGSDLGHPDDAVYWSHYFGMVSKNRIVNLHPIRYQRQHSQIHGQLALLYQTLYVDFATIC
jgi:hypothetical protein